MPAAVSAACAAALEADSRHPGAAGRHRAEGCLLAGIGARGGARQSLDSALRAPGLGPERSSARDAGHKTPYQAQPALLGPNIEFA